MARKYKIDDSDIDDVKLIASRLGVRLSNEKAEKIAQRTYAVVGRYSRTWDVTAQKIIIRDQHMKNPTPQTKEEKKRMNSIIRNNKIFDSQNKYMRERYHRIKNNKE